MENKKPKVTDEPPKEIIKSMQKKCFDGMGIKLPKKDVIAALEKTKEAEEAGKLFKKAIDSWPSLSEKEIENFELFIHGYNIWITNYPSGFGYLGR